VTVRRSIRSATHPFPRNQGLRTRHYARSSSKENTALVSHRVLLDPAGGRGGGLLPGCSGEHAVDHDVDGEAKPLGSIAGDHLRGVGGDQREPVGR